MEEKKIPLVAFMEVDEKRIPVKSWSESGCTPVFLPEDLKEKRWTVGNFIVPFEGFDLTIKELRIEIENNKETTPRCNFKHLTSEQEETLKAIVDMYYRGEIFSIKNLFNALKREKVKAQGKEEKKKSFLFPLITGIILGILTAYFIFKVL